MNDVVLVDEQAYNQLTRNSSTKAPREFIARREQKRILEIFGRLDWDTEYDYKAERNRSS